MQGRQSASVGTAASVQATATAPEAAPLRAKAAVSRLPVSVTAVNGARADQSAPAGAGGTLCCSGVRAAMTISLRSDATADQGPAAVIR